MRQTEVLAVNSTPVSALLRAWQTGEVARALARRVRTEARVPGRARRASAEDTARSVMAYRAGATVEEVAHQFGTHDTTVSARLADTGVVLRTEVRPSERSRMLELFSEGLSMNQVGKQMRRDPKTVRATLVAAGITPPGRRGMNQAASRKFATPFPVRLFEQCSNELLVVHVWVHEGHNDDATLLRWVPVPPGRSPDECTLEWPGS